MISARHTTNRQSFKKVTCPFNALPKHGVAHCRVGVELNQHRLGKPGAKRCSCSEVLDCGILVSDLKKYFFLMPSTSVTDLSP